MRRLLSRLVVPLVLAGATVPPAVAAAAGPARWDGAVATVRAAPRASAVVGTRVLGRSVQGRRITAWHLGQPGRARAGEVETVVLIAVMHGDEPAPRSLLTTLRDGPPLRDVDLWVVPTYNPDGLAAGTRKNAHGVDLNRNYPYRWADLDGETESGPSPASEPETRAMMRFLRDVRPDHVLSFHQPLHGVDVGGKQPRFARRVARALHLPQTSLDCGSSCHGTMTMWFNHEFRGFALTVEYGAHPGRRRMTRQAPRQVLSIFGADSYVTTEPTTT